MTVLDYSVLLVMAASLAAGATRGLAKGVISVTFAVAGVIAAASFYSSAAALFGWLTSSTRTAEMLGFVAVFLLAIALGSVLTVALRRTLKRVKLSWVDHALGASFGLLRGWLICSAAYLALTAFPVRPDAVERATLAPVLLEGTRVISYLTSREMRQRFSDGYDAVRGMWERRSRLGVRTKVSKELRGERNEKQA